MTAELQYHWQTRRYKIKTLSPLHIGGTDPWKKDFDYLYHEKSRTVFFIDYEDFLDTFDIEFLRKTDELEAFQETLLTRFRERKLKILRKYSLAHGVDMIYPFVRGGEQPLIPGSSIKGALRTAVLAAVLKKKLAEGRDISPLLEEYLQKQVGTKKDNIKHSMEAIQVRDLPVKEEKLSLLRFLTYSLQKLEFKEKADKTRVGEAIPADTSLPGVLELRMAYREQDRQQFEGVEEILDIEVTLKNHYRDWLRQEIVFLEKFPSPVIKPVIAFYESLLKKLESGILLLHMGYGTGWEGKTGTFLAENRYLWDRSILEYLKVLERDWEKYRHRFMGILKDSRYLKCPRGHSRMEVSPNNVLRVFCSQCHREYGIEELGVVYPYPKSRKFVYTQKGLMPPGWVELTPGNV